MYLCGYTAITLSSEIRCSHSIHNEWNRYTTTVWILETLMQVEYHTKVKLTLK